MAYSLADVAEEPPVAKQGYTLDDVDPHEVSKLKSASLGAAQGASLGFGDEGSAMVVALAKKMTAKGGNFEENYVKARDALRAKISESKEANPKTYMAGEFAGGMATAPLAGGSPTMARLAALGMVQGLGNSEADLTQGDFAGAAKDTAIGGAIGAAMKPVTWAGGKLLKYAGNIVSPEAWDKLARNRALASLGFTKRFLNTSEKLDAANAAGKTMLDKGVITPGADPQELGFRVNDLVENTGKDIGAFLKSRGGGFETHSAVDAINSIRPKASDGSLLTGGKYDTVNKMLDDAIETVRAHGDTIPFEEANKLKGFLQSMVNYSASSGESTTGKSVARAVKGSIDEGLEKVSTQDEFGKFLESKKTYGEGRLAQDALENRISSEEGNNAFGITDYILAAGAGNPVVAAPAVAAKHAASRYGNQTIAWGADKIAKNLQALGDKIPQVLKSAPQRLGKYAAVLANAAKQGAQAVTVRHFVLSNTDPEYRTMIRSLENDESAAGAPDGGVE